jgi:CHAT domain-containing protein
LRAIENRNMEAVTLRNIGQVYNDLGEKQKALDYYNQALPLSRAVGDRNEEAATLNNIGFVYDAPGEEQKALNYYNQALPLRRAVGDRDGEARTLGNIAYNEREIGKLNDARAHVEAAIAILESLRTKIGSQELRSSFFAGVQGYYEFYIDLLMRLHKQQPDAGYDGKALQASERARARSLLELLTEAGADIRQGVDPQLVERERALQQRLNTSAQQQIQLLTGPHTEAQTAASAKEIENLTTEFQQVETQIRQTSPRYAALTQPVPLTLAEIQTQALDADTVLLEYALGTDRSYLWAVTPTAIMSYELPKRAEIEAAAVEFYESVHTSPQAAANGAAAKREIGGAVRQQAAARGTEAAAQLSRMLLAPVGALLGKKRLLIVADGALQYIPFAALPVPTSEANNAARTPLIVEHEIVSLPSASTLAVLRREAGERRSATKTLAVLADPVFERTDERFKPRAGQPVANSNAPPALAAESRGLSLSAAKSAQEAGVAAADLRIPRLRATRREADAISALAPPAARMEALDFAANRAAATDPALADYRFVHFATHGLLDSQHPELSGLLLSMFDEQGRTQDGFLRAHEVFNLKLNADVVVLSACQTGLGKEVKGEGLVGLTRGFMYAGAPRVVVSLWSVNDAATAELMTRFYRGMLVDKLRPAQALQAAQVSMRNDKRFAAPFYWAAFTLQGEWR